VSRLGKGWNSHKEREKKAKAVMLSRGAFARFLSVVGNAALGLLMGLCTTGLGSANAQESKTIIFDAPGADLTPGDYNGTYASGINGLGVIAGSYQGVDTVFHGFIRRPDGQFTTFEAPGADTTAGSYNGTSPSSINDLGVITGSFYDANGLAHGFLRTADGRFTTFDVPGAGENGTFPIGINLEGAVVGYALDSNDLFHAFLRTSYGKIYAFVGPSSCDTGTSTGCYGNEVTAINLWGISVGNFMDNSGNFVGHGLIRYLNGTLQTFEVPGAGTGTDQGTSCPGCASGLNQWGAIAGTYTDSNNVYHGFLRSPKGEFTTFDAPGAGTESYTGTGCPSDCPTSLNDSGAIMGIYIDSNSVYHGYLRTPDGKIVTVDPSGSDFTWASGMNNLDAITGYYLDANNVYHGFLRTLDR
ncbi:MAG: hypothetical protein WBG35_14440, partial [Acidobacteriaceae bacterium]